MIGGEKARMAVAISLVAAVMTTAQDAQPSHPSHQAMAPKVCSDKSPEESLRRMQAAQSLRETQVEIEMMKKHQGALAGR